MTPHVDDPQLSAPDDAPSRSGRRRDALAVREVCPLLLSVDGGWRSAYGSRDHRCWAVRPPAPLALGKQRQLCLVPAHATCATFVAAEAVAGVRGADPTTRPGGLAPGAALWPAVRSTPLVLEPSRGRTGPLPVSATRTGGQTLLVALMVVAFLVLIIARTGAPSSTGPSPASPGASVTLQTLPAQAASGGPGPSVPVLPSASVAGSPFPSEVPSATASAGAPSPSPSVVRRYKVRSGDTLYGIATRFGTTVSAIKAANGITAQGVIRVGQVLVIP